MQDLTFFLEYVGGTITIFWWAVILAGPLVAWRLNRSWPRYSSRVRRFAIWLMLASVAIGLGTTLTAWRFRTDWPAALALAFSYASVLCLTWIANGRHHASQAIFAARSITLLLTLLVVYGLWVAFWRHSTWDVDTTLTTQQAIGDNVVLIRTSGGMFAQNWEGVTLMQRPAKLPFLERKLYSINIGETDNCNRETVRVKVDSAARLATVQCGDTNPYIWTQVKMP